MGGDEEEKVGIQEAEGFDDYRGSHLREETPRDTTTTVQDRDYSQGGSTIVRYQEQQSSRRR